ncbi:hypothetical protein [Nitrosospira sp. Is2]|uniref:hypothetical protein n=1 Tax=Nitrosospira sp. Is2 TaxID=3080532 RepID=UPI00398666ED
MITITDFKVLKGKTDEIPCEEATSEEKEPHSKEKERPVLEGTGVLSVNIKNDEDLRKYLALTGKELRLWLNGFVMDTDAPAIVVCRNHINLRYYVKPGPNSQKLWISLYHSGKGDRLTHPHPLHVALGWDGANAPATIYSNELTDIYRVSITVDPRKWAAFLLVAFLTGVFIWAIYRTDIFRDVPLPEFWERAKLLRNNLPEDVKKREQWLHDNFSGYDPTKNSEYEQAAKNAAKGWLPPEAENQKTLIGLVLGEPVKSPPRATFSFSRVQMGLWFCFTVLSSVYLWIIYNDLVPIDESILGLVGLSVSTGVISMVVDKDIRETSSYFPSKGIFYDLITSAGGVEKPQIYRFQAIVVNLLLLFIGILHVVQQLTFPTFDPTWLAFLGISGVAYVGGKTVVETKK